jgi:hypothetical protein
MIIFPDLKTKMVLLGSVFLKITAGNLFLLYREFSTFSAMSFRSSSEFYMFILAKETTFWTMGPDPYMVFLKEYFRNNFPTLI